MPDERVRSNHGDHDDDDYLDLDGLARYSHLSTSTIRRYMRDPIRPLPHHRIHLPGKRHGRLLFRKADFNVWVDGFAGTPQAADPPTPAPAAVDVSWVRRAFRKD